MIQPKYYRIPGTKIAIAQTQPGKFLVAAPNLNSGGTKIEILEFWPAGAVVCDQETFDESFQLAHRLLFEEYQKTGGLDDAT